MKQISLLAATTPSSPAPGLGAPAPAAGTAEEADDTAWVMEPRVLWAAAFPFLGAGAQRKAVAGLTDEQQARVRATCQRRATISAARGMRQFAPKPRPPACDLHILSPLGDDLHLLGRE